MSTVDDRIVKMEFDNAGFSEGVAKTTQDLDKLDKALKLDGAAAGLDELRNNISSFEMDSVTSAVEEVGSRFSILQEIATGALRRIGEQAFDLGADLLKKATVQPLIDGFGEYETQMRSIQTISANTGLKGEAGIATINEALDELNEYADMTIYNFSEMTKNIGTFTAAGVDLDTATGAIQGIANLGAISGSTSAQVSTAMYQLSQALASGTVKLQDWNSVVNAGMGGEVFQEALKRTARNHGIAVDQMIEDAGSFRESLKEGWITSEVLTDTLNQLTISYGEVGDEAYNAGMEMLRNAGYSEEDAVAILELAKTAQEAATKVRTWSQLWDTVGEALGSGWAQTWRIIIGDFNQATELFTFFSEKITGIISASANARNKVLQDWSDLGGRDAMFSSLVAAWEGVWRLVSPIVDAFGRVFYTTGQQLLVATRNIQNFLEYLVLSKEDADRLGAVFEGVFKLIHDAIGTVMDLFSGINFNSVADIVNDIFFIFLDGVDIVQSFGQAILGLIDATHVFPLISDAIGFVVDRLADLLDVARKVIDGITGVISPLFDIIADISHIVGDVFDIVLNKIGNSAEFRWIADGFNTIREAASSFIDGLLHPLETVHNFLESIHIFLMTFHEGLTKGLFGGFSALDLFDWTTSDDLAGITEFLGKVIDTFVRELSEFLGVADIFTAKLEDFPPALQPVIAVFGAVGMAVGGAVDAIGNAFGYLKDLKPSKLADDLSTLFDGDWFKGFKGFLSGIHPSLGNGLQSLIDHIIGWFKDLAQNGDSFSQIFIDAWNNVVSFVSSVPDKIGGFFNSIVDFFANSEDPIGDSLRAIQDGFSGFIDFVVGLFTGGQNPVETAMGNVTNSIKGFGDSVGEAFGLGKETVISTGIPLLDSIIKFFTDIFSTISDKASPIIESIKNFTKDFVENFPTPEQIGQSLSNVANGVGEFFNGLFTGFNGQSAANEMKNEIESGFSGTGGWSIDFGGFFLGLFDGLASAVDEIISNDHLGNIINKLASYLTRIIGVIMALNIAGAAKSIKAGFKEFGGAFKQIGSFFKEAKEGLSLFKTTISVFGPETKFDAFLKICAGLLAIAAAIWLVVDAINKGGPGALEQAIGSLALMVGLVVAVQLLMNVIENISGYNFSGAGMAFAAFGVGLLAMSAALYIMIHIPFEQALPAVIALGLLMAGLAKVMKSIQNDGPAYKGAAAAFVALAAALILMLIPIGILGNADPWVVAKGLVFTALAAAVLTAAATLATKWGGTGRQFAGFGIAMVALAAAINMMLIPIILLGSIDQNVVSRGWIHITFITAVLALAATLATRFGGSAAQFAAFGLAMVAMAVAVNLMIIPISLIAMLDFDGRISRAIFAVGLLIVFMGLMTALMATAGANGGAGNAAKMALSMLLLAAAVDALALAFLMLQKVDFWAVLPPFLLIIAAFVAFGAAAVFLTPLEPILLLLGGALLMFGGACLMVAGSIWLIAQSLDEFANMAPEKAARAGEAMGSALAGMLKGFATEISKWLDGLFKGMLEDAMAKAQAFLGVGLAVGKWISDGLNSVGGFLQEQAAKLVGVDLMNGCEVNAEKTGTNTANTLSNSLASGIKANKSSVTGAMEETVNDSTDIVASAAPQMSQATETGINTPIFEKLGELLFNGEISMDQFQELMTGKLDWTTGIGENMGINTEALTQSLVDMGMSGEEAANIVGQLIPQNLANPEAYSEAANANMTGENGFLTTLSNLLAERGLDISTASTEQIVDVLKDEAAFQDAGFVDADSFIDYLSNMLPEGVNIADLTKEQILDLLRDPKNFEYVAKEDEQASVKGFTPLSTHWGEIGDRAKNFALSTLTKPNEFMNSASTNEKAYETGFQPIVTSSGTIANNAGNATISNLQNHDYAGTGNRIQNDVVSSASALIENLGNVASSGGRAFVSAIEATNAWSAGRGLAESGKSGAESVDYSSSGAAVAAGFAAGIGARSWEAVQEAQAMASRVKGIINGVMGIASPSKVTRESGQFVAEGFALGIRDNSYMVAQSAEDLANVVPDTLGGGLESLRDSLSAIVDESLDTDPVIRPVLDLTDVNNNAQLLSGLLSGGNQAYTLAGIIQNQDPYGLSSLGSIDTTNRDLVDKIEMLRADLQAYTEAAANSAVVMDTGALVGQLTPGIDMAMGQRQVMASRGVF